MLVPCRHSFRHHSLLIFKKWITIGLVLLWGVHESTLLRGPEKSKRGKESHMGQKKVSCIVWRVTTGPGHSQACTVPSGICTNTRQRKACLLSSCNLSLMKRTEAQSYGNQGPAHFYENKNPRDKLFRAAEESWRSVIPFLPGRPSIIDSNSTGWYQATWRKVWAHLYNSILGIVDGESTVYNMVRTRQSIAIWLLPYSSNEIIRGRE